MDSGYYAACTGLISRMEALDAIANNLANADTVGYRSQHNVFSSVLADTGRSALSVLNQDTNNFGILSRIRMDDTQGALKRTGNDLDVAIDGPGYFTVQTHSGEAYTRNGSFHVSSGGQLVTAAGDPVLGENGPVTVAGASISVRPDGTLQAQGAIIAKLKLVEFAPTVSLQSRGAAYYTAPEGTAKPATQSALSQGELESSNVNPVSSVVEMISAQREMEGMRRVITTLNVELDKTATQELSRV